MTMRTLRLLVLDDELSVVEFLRDSLVERGFEVEGHTSPATALERLDGSRFDLVISDMQMPGLHGTDIVSAVLKRQPEQLLLLMTAFGSIELAVAAVRAGACDFIAKPFKIEALVFAIERAFRDRAMRREVVRLRSTASIDESGTVVARSHAMRTVVERARRAAGVDATVLLTGETGTGKGVIARFIHDTSTRKTRPFHHVNCATVPPSLMESELFGVRRGAFTDAREDRLGAFAAAADGTLFLDEVGELPIDTQAKLLHALESGRVRALGATSDTPFRARVIAATNRPLEELLRQGRFRPDLYYRLNVIRIELPPLRERRDDIVPLVDAMLRRVATSPRGVLGVSAAALRRLMTYAWPGNVRELGNVIERAVALTEHDILLPEDLELSPGVDEFEMMLASAVDGTIPLEELERTYVLRVLEQRKGNKAETARVLGIDRRTLYRMLGRTRADQ
jgi:DNA-binding NtrC family response regulator